MPPSAPPESTANLCNLAVVQWQSAPGTVSTDVTSGPAPVVVTTVGYASLDEVAGPKFSESDAAFPTGSDPTFPTVAAGQQVIFTFTVNVPEGGLAGAKVQDTLPAGLTIPTTSATGFAVTAVPPGADKAALSADVDPTTSPPGPVVSDTGGGTDNQILFTFATIANTGDDAADFSFTYVATVQPPTRPRPACPSEGRVRSWDGRRPTGPPTTSALRRQAPRASRSSPLLPL